MIGTGVSGGFLYLIAGLNLAVLWRIVRVFREARHGRFDETRLEAELDSRGFMNRLFGRFTRDLPPVADVPGRRALRAGL